MSEEVKPKSSKSKKLGDQLANQSLSSPTDKIEALSFDYMAILRAVNAKSVEIGRNQATRGDILNDLGVSNTTPAGRTVLDRMQKLVEVGLLDVQVIPTTKRYHYYFKLSELGSSKLVEIKAGM